MAVHSNARRNWSETGQESHQSRFAAGESVAKLCQRFLPGNSSLVKCRALALGGAALCTGFTAHACGADRPACDGADARICGAPGTGFYHVADSATSLRQGGLPDRKAAEFKSSFSLPGSPFFADASSAEASSARDRVEIVEAGAHPDAPCDKRFPAGQGAIPACLVAFPDNPYFQFASLTARRALFTSGPHGLAYVGLNTQDRQAPLPLLAYASTFGGAFLPALSLEKPLLGTGSGAKQLAAGEAAPSGKGRSPESAFADAARAELTSGITGNLRLAPAWGTVSVPLPAPPPQAGFPQAGALAAIAPLPPPAGFAPSSAAPSLNSSSYAFAASLNFDYLPVADKLWLEAAYDKGAPGDSAGGTFTTGHSPVSQPRAMDAQLGSGSQYAGWNPQINSSCAFARGSKCEQPRGWDITGVDKNYWLPILNSTLFGSSLEIRHQADAPNSAVNSTGSANLSDAHIAAQLLSSPLGAFDIGAEFMYAHVSQLRPPGPGQNAPVSGLRAFGPSTELYDGHLRVQGAY